MEERGKLIHWRAHNPEQNPDASLLLRRIIHLDMDAFYASVEMRDNPELRHKPIVVGGAPGGRGVVATANYLARSFGVRSAMATSHALRLCPQLTFVRPRFEVYQAVSQTIRGFMKEYSQQIQPISLDEAYLDVTHHPMRATEIAASLQQRIHRELHLTSSAGVGPNKLIAKISSDFLKPFGITVVTPESVLGFMANLPLKTIPGVGPVTKEKLAKRGYHLCKDITNTTLDKLTDELGQRQALWLWRRCHGLSSSEVHNSHERKSVGRERTFSQDLSSYQDVMESLTKISEDVALRLAKNKLKGRTVQLKLRFRDFTTLTRAHSLPSPTANGTTILEVVINLLEKAQWQTAPIRLLGISLSNLTTSEHPSRKNPRIFQDIG